MLGAYETSREQKRHCVLFDEEGRNPDVTRTGGHAADGKYADGANRGTAASTAETSPFQPLFHARFTRYSSALFTPDAVSAPPREKLVLNTAARTGSVFCWVSKTR